jgi:membrane protease YdiL (CAAX protease family)
MKRIPSKIGAVAEAIVVFALAVVVFQGIHAASFSVWEQQILPGQGLFILEYGAVLTLVLVLLAVTRRGWTRYGVTLKDSRRQARVVAVGFLPLLGLGGVLGMVDWKRGTGAGIVSLTAVGVLVIMGWALRKEPTTEGMMAALLLAALPLATEIGIGGEILLKTAYFYLLVGPSEELLFRGYIQSRLDEAYGRPFRFFGVEWGWGLIVAAALFGLWHVVWTPLEAGAWFHGLWTFFAGLVFGYARAKSGGVAAASLLHSVMNYLPLFELVRI